MKTNQKYKKILITGMQGALAKITAEILLKYIPNLHIVGIDTREITGFEHRTEFTLIHAQYSRQDFEKVFREHKFDALLHLGRLASAALNSKSGVKADINLIGTNTLLELAHRFKLKKIVILSSHHVYGALPDLPLFLPENFPLRANFKFSELRDIVEMDQICANWMWKNKSQLETLVLRPAHIVGPQINNAISSYLKSPYALSPMDFNPQLQFIHEYDMGHMIALGLISIGTGIYNIAPKEVISLKDAIEIVKIPKMPFPFFTLKGFSQLNSMIWPFPQYLIDYLKYSTVIDGSHFERELRKSMFDQNLVEPLYRFNIEDCLNFIRP